jgi:hypothetical protein
MLIFLGKGIYKAGGMFKCCAAIVVRVKSHITYVSGLLSV